MDTRTIQALEERDKYVAELKLELRILTRAYNELFKLHYGYEPDTKEVVGHVKGPVK